MLEKNDEVVIYTYYRLKESEVQEIIDFIKSNDERALEAIYIGNGSNYLADRHVIAQDVEFTRPMGGYCYLIGKDTSVLEKIPEKYRPLFTKYSIKKLKQEVSDEV